MTVMDCARAFDPFLTRQKVERGERWLSARARLLPEDFDSLRLRLGVPEYVVVDEMLFASDSHARTFAEFGEERARVLMLLPAEFRTPFLRTHDVWGMGVFELFSSVHVFAKLAADDTGAVAVGGGVA